ncbi:MAG: hypothetical protein QXK65_02570 [Candidatus Micrarchaeaceae archaeon]
MKGIISSIRHSTSGEELCTIIGDGTYTVSCDTSLKLYDSVEFELGEPGKSGYNKIEVNKLENSEKNGYEQELKKAEERLFSKRLLKTGIKRLDDVLDNMSEQIFAAGKRIIRNVASGAPIVIRFHNDGDGSSGAIALFRAISAILGDAQGKAINISYRINKSIAYSSSSLWSDKLFFNSFESIEKPLVVIIDFGTTEESYGAIASAIGIDFIWVDHHPIPQDFPVSSLPLYINPWQYRGDSNETAGAIACVLAATLGKQPQEALSRTQELALISMVSDHSEFAPSGQLTAEKALVLDHITSKRLRYGDMQEPALSPRSMSEVLSDDAKWKEVFKKARAQLDEALKAGIKHAKHYKSVRGFRIVELDFGHVSALDYEILPGRYSSKLHDEVSAVLNEDVVLIVHYANSISIRLGKKLSKSINILDIINRMKESKQYLLNGGGHMEAASIKVEEGHLEDALDALFTELGAERNS